jgi:ATP-dependent exoDNAse (exonuclease V) alpha subunit
MIQKDALAILQTGANVFLTGSPGSGKTYTVRAYIDWLRSHGIEPAITASTGVAATHIHGQTIHAWSGIGITDNFTQYELDRIAGKEPVAKRIQKTSVLIIDEISMLSGTILDAVDAVCKQVRGNELPFGGMQVVLVGDFFQLPPVAGRGRAVQFAFESRAWKFLHVLTCYLTEQHRQEDSQFLSLLTAIRAGSFAEDEGELLQERFTSVEKVSVEVPRLYTHNADVDRINEAQLAALPGNAKVFQMESSGTANLVESLKRGCLSPERLTLKEGAIVMCTKNNPSLGYANGTLGKVIGFSTDDGYPMIETRDGRTIILSPVEWVVEEDGRIRARIAQIPLRLAWAITVHKSQGQSLDAAAMDLSRSFEYGQGYVALSRVRTLEGLHLLGWSAQALAIHPLVSKFDFEFQQASEAAEESFAELEESGEREVMEQNFIKAAGGTIETQSPEKVRGSSLNNTYQETLSLIRDGKSIQEIVTLRSLTFGTICDHIEKLSQEKLVTSEEIEKLVPETFKKHIPEIGETFKSVGFERLAPVYSELGEMYSYDELKLARAVLRSGLA